MPDPTPPPLIHPRIDDACALFRLQRLLTDRGWSWAIHAAVAGYAVDVSDLTDHTYRGTGRTLTEAARTALAAAGISVE